MSVTRDRINTFFRYKDLLRELVVRDVKLKYEEVSWDMYGAF